MRILSTIDIVIDLLNKQNKKQKDLTDFLGITKNSFTDWKSGRIKSYQKHLPRIADFFGVSVDYLLGQSDNENFKSLTPKEKKLISEYRNKPEMQGAIDKLLGLDEPQIIPIKQQNGKVAAFGGDMRNITLSEDDISKLKNITDKT